MKGVLRWSGFVAAGTALLLLVSAGVVFAMSEIRLERRFVPRPESLAAPDEGLQRDAARRATAYGCVSCHGAGVRGKLLADIAGVARVHAPNLTRIAATATDQQLAQAIRQGIGRDGRGLMVMPAYAHLGDEETAAIVAWLRSLSAVPGGEETVTLRPIGRVAVAAGKLLPVVQLPEAQRLQRPVDVGVQHAEGRRLATIICASCHGPALAGQAMQEGPPAPDLQIAAAYDPERFRTLMRTGKGLSDRDLGEMGSAAREALFALTDEEIDALHGYLQARAKVSGG